MGCARCVWGGYFLNDSPPAKIGAKDWEVEATVVEGEGEQGSSRDVDGGQFQPC